MFEILQFLKGQLLKAMLSIKWLCENSFHPEEVWTVGPAVPVWSPAKMQEKKIPKEGIHIHLLSKKSPELKCRRKRWSQNL